MQEQIPTTFADLLKDYPFIAKGLKKLKIVTPLDLQDQLLSIPNQLHNLIVSAPEQSGKKLALLILAMKRFANQEEGILGLISHSKQMAQELSSLCSVICRTPCVNLFMEKCNKTFNKLIIIGSPLQLNNLQKQIKDKILSLTIFQADFIFSFGYGEYLQQLASSIPPSVFYQISCINKGQQIEQFKAKWMKKATKINYQPPEQQQKQKNVKLDGQVSHFYEAGEKLMGPISLYVTLKFGLVNPKILILVSDLVEVYRYYLFLERTKIQGIGLYNHENPIDLKFYGLSLWMNGSTNILIATRAIYDDLESGIFKQNCHKNYKRNNFALINLSTVITINLKHCEGYFNKIFSNFNNKPVIMTFVENTEEQIGSLQNLMAEMKKKFEISKSKEYPIGRKQLEAFKYRIEDVFNCLGKRKVEMLKQYDFKKKMLKSPDLKKYFEENQKEKEVLIKEISGLKKRINSETITLSEYVPPYLVPEILKNAYNEQQKQIQSNMKQEEVPAYIQKARGALRHVDLQEQDPEVTDISRLKLVSARKRWKLQHGFKLRKRNVRKQKKGVFETN